MSASAALNLMYREPLVTEPRISHTATVIMLHGLGDSGDGWSDIGQMFAPALPYAKFIFPNAPKRAITLNGGMTMPGWYDITSLDRINAVEDAQGLKASLEYVEGLIKKEGAAGVPPERVVVAGFSQGGAVALMSLRLGVKLAAVVGLSTYVPLKDQPGVVSDANKATPVFLAHGDRDPVVNYQFGQESAALLKDLGVKLTFRTYNGMAHSACPEELGDLSKFLATQLPPL